MKRRTLVLGGGAAAAVGGLWWLRSGGVALSELASRRTLTYPTQIDATESRAFSLQAQAGKTEFFEGQATNTLGFNQGYLGPVVRVGQGEVAATVSNTLQRTITCHWHGLILPGQVDGGPHQPIASGTQWKPVLDIKQEPCTAWFHTHVHGETATGVYAGLAGGLVVSDGRDDERGLPQEYGKDDLFLILQDKGFTEDGELYYDQSMPSIMHGFSASTMMVNGQIGAVARPAKGIIRCRLLNASNARIFNLSFQSGRDMHLIATDGGYLPKPVQLSEMRLAPGERAEILVDFSDGNPDALLSERDMNAGMGGMMGRFQQMGSSLVGRPFEVLTFQPDDDPGRITRMPDQLAKELPNPQILQITQTRRLSLDVGMGPGMMMGGGMRRGAMGDIMAINQQPYDMNRIDFEVKKGSWERWVISAETLAHPFHVHGVSFLVVSENGTTPTLRNAGWKDTVLVNQDIELVARFDQPASPQQPFMYHCHILEHEDTGMMGQFAVV